MSTNNINNSLYDPYKLKQEFEAKLKALAEPFEVDEVYWLPQSTKGTTAVAAAYANKRAYTDRLDEVLGAAEWQIEVSDPVITEYIKTVKEKRAVWNDPTSAVLIPASQEKNYKVLVQAKCGLWVSYLNQWVWKSSTGVAAAEDENSVTTAEAQAVKRAISMWGPGNYFYRLGTQTVPYSLITKTFTVKPTLPDWAIPAKHCIDCKNTIKEFSWKKADGSEQVLSASDVLKNGKAKYGADLCVNCQKIRRDKI